MTKWEWVTLIVWSLVGTPFLHWLIIIGSDPSHHDIPKLTEVYRFWYYDVWRGEKQDS